MNIFEIDLKILKVESSKNSKRKIIFEITILKVFLHFECFALEALKIGEIKKMRNFDSIMQQ